MREIYTAQMDEFHSYAYYMYLTGEDVVKMNGDRFFLMETEKGDEWDGVILKSIREEAFFEWNDNGWWQSLSDEDVPAGIENITLNDV